MTSQHASEARARTRICLSCRTLYDEGEDCSGKKHQTVSLRKTTDRNRLDEEVWGPDSRARALRKAAKAGAGGAGFGGITQGCDIPGFDGCDGGGEAILVILAIIVFAIVAVLLYWLIRAIVRWIREAMDRPKPHGALLDPPKPRAGAVAARGVVRSGAPLAMPWTAGSVFAYAVELYEARVLGGGAMLRDARSAGFEVTLDDGRLLRVPAGRLRILAKREKVAMDESRLRSFVGQIDAERVEGERPLFPFDHARAVTIAPGDRVEVLGDVELNAGASAGYRESAAIVVPVGVPVLRVRKSKDAVPALAEQTVDTDEAG